MDMQLGSAVAVGFGVVHLAVHDVSAKLQI
jgi:hypothetical protein